MVSTRDEYLLEVKKNDGSDTENYPKRRPNETKESMLLGYVIDLQSILLLDKIEKKEWICDI